MKSVTIKAVSRSESGSKSAKELRKEGMVPCVIYGGANSVNCAIPKNDLNPIIYTGEFFKVIVDVDGTGYETIVKDMQFHPVTDDVLHMDFQELVTGRKVRTSIPVVLEGNSVGVRAGGVLQHKLLRLNVRVKPENMIESITLDVSDLELGASLKVADLDVGAIEVLDSMNIPVASVISPRALRSAQSQAEEAEDVEGAEGEEAEGEEAEA